MTPAAGPSRYRWAILAVFFMVMGLSGVGNFIYPAISTFIADDLGLSASQIGMLGAAPFFGALLFNLVAGYFVDRLGVRRSAAICGAALTAFFLLSTLTTRFEVLLVLAVAFGVAMSFLNPLTQKGTYLWFPPREFGLAVGVKQGGIPAGSAANAALLPIVCAIYGWQGGFVAGAMVTAVITVLVVGIYRDPVRPDGKRAPVELPKLIHVLEPATRLGPFLIGLIGFTHGALTISAVNFFIPILRDFDVDVIVAGAYLALAQFISVFARPVIGLVSDRMGSSGRATFLGLYVALGAALFALTPLVLPYAQAPIALLALAVGLGLVNSWSGLYYAAISEVGGAGRVGVSTSFGALANSLGTSTGPVLFGIMADKTGSWTPGLLIVAALSVVSGLLCAFFAGRKPQQPIDKGGS
ncbi:MAG: MFS transporter [Microvirga sp.]|nr:MFS transporter [Microvirga sp.]